MKKTSKKAESVVKKAVNHIESGPCEEVITQWAYLPRKVCPQDKESL